MKSSAALARILAVSAIMVFAGVAAAQQAYPNKPIRVIVPYPPGGNTDPMARLVGQKLTESWGQQVIIDNRGGGNTIIGTEAAAKAPPDGYTLLWVASAFVITPSLLPYLPYDTIRDFDAVASVSLVRNVLVLNPSVPANNLQELIALAKSKPGQLNYASAGVATANHLAGELFNMIAGVRMQHVPYKGSGPLIADLVAGQVQLSFQAVMAVTPYIKSGKLKPIVIGGEARLPALPQVPTYAEAGLPGYDLVRAANAVGVEPVVRVPSSDPGVILPYLETGAATIIVPHCYNAEIVRLAVSAGKHPPKGVRGVGSGSRAANYGLTQTPVQYFAEADEQTLILPMIEDAEAIKNIDAILAVEGLEGIFIGLGDLSMTMGYRGGQNHPVVREAVSLVIEKARARGLIVSASGGRDVESARAMVKQGIQMVLSGAATLLAEACRNYLKGVRE